MAKKPGTNPKGEFVFFDVVYRTAAALEPARAGRDPRRADRTTGPRASSSTGREIRGEIRPRAAGDQDHPAVRAKPPKLMK